jgi:hypothetical protein
MTMKAAALILALTLHPSVVRAECVREGGDKVREFLSGVAGAAASSLVARTFVARPHTYRDYHVDNGIAFSPQYNRRMMVSYAVGNAVGILIATPRECQSWWRPLPGTIVPTIPFWSASEKPFGMIFSSMFLPPFQAAGGTLTNSIKR